MPDEPLRVRTHEWAGPGGHALEIIRRYLDPAGAPLAVSVSLHPAGRFSSAARLRRLPSRNEA
jgi:GntR family transcriptional regulator